ncbi:hypothetical protein PAEPH01_0022 [Pancytospora epiphaga]|nr:hypothetical protein PAEPH01_0022 [Pancytospora epiphaga]
MTYCGSSEYDFDSSDETFMESYRRVLINQTRQLFNYKDENELIGLAESKTMIVHFYSQSFKKCIFMNKALGKLAPKLTTIKFVCIEASRAPSMARSLGIKTLPFLAFFREGYLVDQIIGFEKLGNNNDGFEVGELEKYIKESPLIRGLDDPAVPSNINIPYDR